MSAAKRFLACCLWAASLALPCRAADWTFMVYMCGDNDLELAGINDFLEMARAGSSAQVNIVVQFDRSPAYDTSYGNWSGARRGLVQRNDLPDANWGTPLGDINTGDPQNLSDFVIWAMQSYPATRYALILWDHGNGWRFKPALKAVGTDETSGDDLSTRELRMALESIRTNARDPDLIGFDACLMGMVEVAYEVRQHATVMVGPEQTEPLAGWPYDTLLPDLIANPTMTPRTLGQTIVTRYYQDYSGDGFQGETIAACDLTTLDALATAVDSFGQMMRNKWRTDAPACAAEAGRALLQLDATVFAEAHGTALPGSHGLAIYFPTNTVDPAYNSTTIQFAAQTRWDEFLADFCSTIKNSWLYAPRSQSQSYYFPEHIDLYDFCRRTISAVPSLRWVDFYYSGTEVGTFDQPHNTLAKAAAASSSDQTICIKYGTSPEILTINKPVTIRAALGPVTIGH